MIAAARRSPGSSANFPVRGLGRSATCRGSEWSAALSMEKQPEDPPWELSESLPGLDLYVLCEVMGVSLPILYASPGYKALFALSAFQELSGCDHIMDHPHTVDRLSSMAGLSCIDVKAGLSWLEAEMEAVGKKVAAGARFVNNDRAWVVRVTRDGEPIVCEVTFVLHWSEAHGDILAAVHEDASAGVSLRELLKAVAAGEGRAFIESLKELADESLYCRGPLLSSALREAGAEDSEAGRGRCEALRGVLATCGSGPVSFRLTRGGIVPFGEDESETRASAAEASGKSGVGSSTHAAAATPALIGVCSEAGVSICTTDAHRVGATRIDKRPAAAAMPTAPSQAVGCEQTSMVVAIACVVLQKMVEGKHGSELWVYIQWALLGAVMALAIVEVGERGRVRGDRARWAKNSRLQDVWAWLLFKMIEALQQVLAAHADKYRMEVRIYGEVYSGQSRSEEQNWGSRRSATTAEPQ